MDANLLAVVKNAVEQYCSHTGDPIEGPDGPCPECTKLARVVTEAVEGYMLKCILGRGKRTVDKGRPVDGDGFGN